MTDAEALRRVRAGERDAFRVLVERYQGRAYRVALRMLRNEEAARDAVQEAFVKAYRALPRFQGRSRFYTWLYRLVVNQCLDARRRDRSARQVAWEEAGALPGEGPPEPRPEVHGVVFGPAAELMRKQLRDRIAAAVETLPEGARETLLLREADGLSYAEIARALGIPKGTVMSRLHYARRQLRERLDEAGVEPPGKAAKRPRSEAKPSEGGPPPGKAAQRPRSEAKPSEGAPPHGKAAQRPRSEAKPSEGRGTGEEEP